MKHFALYLVPLPFILISPLLLNGCTTVCPKPTAPHLAALGESKSQIIKELGAPTAHYMNGFDLFHDNGNEVQAHFKAGKADSLFYFTFDRKISKPWLSSVLKLNSRGTSWVLEESSASSRKVYRSQDGKFHAFVSKGNQLMVDTDSFFQKALHQPGKTIHVDSLPECIFAPDHTIAKIGDTESFIVRNYGPEYKINKNKSDLAKLYFDGCQTVFAHYKAGVADAVLYEADNYKRLNDCWVSRLLANNSGNRAWIVPSFTRPNRIYYRTPHSDLLADMRDRKTLLVYKWDYDPNFNSGNGKRELLKKPPAAKMNPCSLVWIGETEAAMSKKLGHPTLDKDVRIYRDGDLIIRARFDHGVCKSITYISEKKRKFTDHWVSATLGVNSGGRAWLVDESDIPKEIHFKTFDHTFYALLTDGNELRVTTEAFLKKRLMELEDKRKKSQ
ncbi:MAG: hypothetical protein K8R57_11140 [Verrucomicrobia bacterium]|nr:hypothetical protein [Verrucomicrobiota bacterium]